MIKAIYRKLAPKFIRDARSNFIEEKKAIKNNRLSIRAINDYFEQNPKEKEKYAEEIAWIHRTGTVRMLPYEFTNKYASENLMAFRDQEKNLTYIMHCGKRLYFSKDMTINNARQYYIQLLIEQDEASPHLYMTEAFESDQVVVVADVGSAEAIFALDLVERAKAVYLFECEPQWQEALQATFEPWKEKVTIVNKFVSDKIGDTETTLDYYFKDLYQPLLIKMDVEGAEAAVLRGASETLKKDKVKVICCTYHKQNDAEDFEKLLRLEGYNTELSRGYMLMHFIADLKPPFFRKGVIRAWK